MLIINIKYFGYTVFEYFGFTLINY